MFDSKDDQQPADQFGAASSSPLMPDTPVSAPVTPSEPTNDSPATDATFSAPTIVAPSDTSTLASPAPASDMPAPDTDTTPDTAPLPSVGSVSSPASDTHDDLLTPPNGDDDLLKLKQDALQQLSPLVGHLDQTPEEKFRTTMMMIQATDDKSLLPQAYESAQKITDEKERAQALLDVVNEINYFSQHHDA